VERLFNCGPRSSLIFSMFTVFGTTLLCLCFTLVSLHQLRGLQSQIREAQAQKEEIDRLAHKIWRTFRGLEAYHEKGEDYLLTLPGWTIRSAGTVNKKTAWIVTKGK
jgi:hypothetical protein